MKYIDRKNVKLDVWYTLSETITKVWVETTVHYKYTAHWHRFAQFQTDICGFLNGSTASYLLDIVFSRLSNYTNTKHPCPFSGTMFFRANNISAQFMSLPQIMPAGLYRLGMNFTGTNQASNMLHFLANWTLFFSVSDHRIEIV